jgi:hypothetical protein
MTNFTGNQQFFYQFRIVLAKQFQIHIISEAALDNFPKNDTKIGCERF